MRERRRLALAARQLTLARVARREAIAALGDAINEEQRSTQLAMRSRDLVREYGARGDADSGDALRNQAIFVEALNRLAQHSEAARRDAGEQVAWQAQTLAAADTRASRLAERLEAARQEVEAFKERRANGEAAGLARKLQISAGQTDPRTKRQLK